MTKDYVVVNVELTGQRLREVIKEKGYSIREIQYMLDFSCPSAIYRWLHGKSLPSLMNLYRLSQFLQTPMETLLVTDKILIQKEYEY